VLALFSHQQIKSEITLFSCKPLLLPNMHGLLLLVWLLFCVSSHYCCSSGLIPQPWTFGNHWKPACNN